MFDEIVDETQIFAQIADQLLFITAGLKSHQLWTGKQTMENIEHEG